MISIRKKDHNGIKFTMFEANEALGHGEVAVKGGKYTLQGTPSVTKAYNQYKFGDEIIVQVYGSLDSATRRERVTENYDRVQVFFKKELFLEMCKAILRTEGYLVSAKG